MTAPVTVYYHLNYIMNMRDVPGMDGYVRTKIATDNDGLARRIQLLTQEFQTKIKEYPKRGIYKCR